MIEYYFTDLSTVSRLVHATSDIKPSRTHSTVLVMCGDDVSRPGKVRMRGGESGEGEAGEVMRNFSRESRGFINVTLVIGNRGKKLTLHPMKVAPIACAPKQNNSTVVL